ncbi:hypothetical protein PGT21_034480 [Puccinia graminis f. sp. tritici]|uniref:Uncharacterized protein n=1 Tax=Puccinia graminis f. sp. tritici TaxID=56615 RepID=A0A5B0LKB3_PUCGR|nr:hypothetical protein PGTUg99_021877 [Puccinia graminis f. sp. tritici]KAA1095006.1 hypothetical protein PGT21_034480 [Puccinia graminis f. sp. tritici]
MLLLQTLVITCGVVLPTLSIPVGNTVAEISKDAARKHNYLGLTADDRLVASNTKPSESSNQELGEVVPLEAGSSGASTSNEVTVESGSKHASYLQSLTQFVKSMKSKEMFWRYAPAPINGLSCYSLHYFFPSLFENVEHGFPHFGFLLSTIPGLALLKIRPSFDGEVIASEEDSKQTSYLERLAELTRSTSIKEKFWRYAPASINGLSCLSLHYLFPSLFKTSDQGFPYFGFFLSNIPGLTLLKVRPSVKTVKWD